MSGDMAVALPTRLLSLTWQVSHGTTAASLALNVSVEPYIMVRGEAVAIQQ